MGEEGSDLIADIQPTTKKFIFFSCKLACTFFLIHKNRLFDSFSNY